MKVKLRAFLVASLLSAVYSESSVEFCYHLPTCNASTWPTIIPVYCNGTRQSPINIETANVQPDSSLTAFSFKGFNNQSNILNIKNTGRSVVIELDGEMMSVSGGGLQTQYNSAQFHIHWGNGTSTNGSEHTVDGQKYAMEMHIVNIRSDLSAAAAATNSTGYAALGFFIEATNDTGKPESWKTLTSFLSNITKAGETLDIMNQLTMDSLIQGVDLTKYYRYLGSLTVPRCEESVVWSIFKEPIKVSKDLIDLFSTTVHINTTADPFLMNTNRPLMAKNGRVVTSQPATTTATASTASTASTATTATTTTSPSSASTLYCTLFISTALLYYVLF